MRWPTSGVVLLAFCTVPFCSATRSAESFPSSVDKSLNKATCGGTLLMGSSSMATVLSPNFPNYYPLNMNCVWRILTTQDKTIRVYSLQFQVEASDNCQYDSLTITENYERVPIGRFCGRLNTGLLAESSSNVITISFLSDYVVNGAGFYLLVQTVNKVLPINFTPTPLLTTTSISSGSQCPVGTQNCPGVMFPCLKPSQICDGIRDCADGSDELNCLTSKCGRPKILPSTATKIVGGVEAVPHSFPWQVALYTSSGTQICGATIISTQWILTAAHCCNAYSGTADSFRVRIGAHRLSSTTEPFDKVLRLESITVHPQYLTNDQTTVWDYCLMKTQQAMTFSDHVQPACLPSAADGAPGTKCYVTGWGSVDQVLYTKSARAARPAKAQPDALNQVDVVIQSLASCNASSVYNGGITPQMICAASPGHDSCQGDSGGPLTCPDPADPTKFKLVGVVSWGWGCADPGYPGIYARVASALSWITSVTGIQTNP